MLPAAPIQIPQNKALGKAKETELGEDLKDPWRSRTGRGARCPARSTATVLVHQALSSPSRRRPEGRVHRGISWGVRPQNPLAPCPLQR